MSTTGVMRQIDSPNSSSSSSSGGISGGGSGNAPADDSPDVEVRKADQEMINEFGRLNNKYIELDEDLTGLKEQLEKLDDAVTELMVGVGGPVRLLLGEAFVEVSEDYATEYCERKQEQLQARVEELGAEKEGIAARQMELKKALYGRFGNSINLESS
ncbi:hypothetical protein VYU27_001294 [Nannochloropsis oceanica]